MDDTKTLVASILFSALFLSAIGVGSNGYADQGSSEKAVDIEYIAPEKEKELESGFEKATFRASKDGKALSAGNWNCEMYGVRSKMRVHRDLKLYKFTEPKTEDKLAGSEASPAWKNGGSQLVNDYKAENGALVGSKEPFEDQVKLTSDGKLVSRLSVKAPTKMVVAYSVCKSL